MDNQSLIALVMGSSWTSGINLYLTIAGLGIAERYNWIHLPGDLNVISNPCVITIAVILYLVEFLVDKVPFVDSIWDVFHTVIRPLAGILIAFGALADVSASVQFSGALLAGGITTIAHLSKALTRMAINASPEPFSNSVASITEDGLVALMLFFIIKHPIIAIITAIIFLVISIFLIIKLYKFAKIVINKINEFLIKLKK